MLLDPELEFPNWPVCVLNSTRLGLQAQLRGKHLSPKFNILGSICERTALFPQADDMYSQWQLKGKAELFQLDQTKLSK